MAVPFFDITRQNRALEKEIDSAVRAVIKSGHFILGENVAALQKEVAAYCGVKYAVGVASGTDALHLALRACGIKEGDEVITSPFTFVATAEAIAYCGAMPIFADIEPKTFDISPAKIGEKITRQTKAVLPVHLYGQACEMDKITEIAKKYGLKVIEDCAQAIGAEYKGRKVGSFGDTGCFSFFPTKNLGGFGDGGMITTNRAEIADQIKALRGHGSRMTYHYDIIGYNSRLDELQASILRVKMANLERGLAARRKNAARYRQILAGTKDTVLPEEDHQSKHVYNQYTVRAKKRDELFEFLKNRGIGSMAYYPLSLHLQKAFAYLGNKEGDFPESEKAQAEVLSLPIYPELTESEINAVGTAIKDFFKI